MNAQEKFDIVAKHLLTQEVQSSTDKGGCMYRGPNGAKCAFGVLIPDHIFDSRFESNMIEDLMTYTQISKIVGDDLNLLTDLQCLHDGAAPNQVSFNEHEDEDEDVDKFESFYAYRDELAEITEDVVINQHADVRLLNHSKIREGLEFIANYYGLSTKGF